MEITKTVDVDVDIDDDDVIDMLREMDDAHLVKYGLCRFASGYTGTVDHEARWRAIAQAVRQGDQHQLLDLISQYAWDVAGVVIPVVDVRRAA